MGNRFELLHKGNSFAVGGTKLLTSGKHQVEVKLILVCFETVSLADFSAVCQGMGTTFASGTAKHFHGAGDGSSTGSSVAHYLLACQTDSTEWYLSKLI